MLDESDRSTSLAGRQPIYWLGSRRAILPRRELQVLGWTRGSYISVFPAYFSSNPCLAGADSVRAQKQGPASHVDVCELKLRCPDVDLEVHTLKVITYRLGSQLALYGEIASRTVCREALPTFCSGAYNSIYQNVVTFSSILLSILSPTTAVTFRTSLVSVADTKWCFVRRVSSSLYFETPKSSHKEVVFECKAR